MDDGALTFPSNPNSYDSCMIDCLSPSIIHPLSMSLHKDPWTLKHGFISNNQVCAMLRGHPRKRNRSNPNGGHGPAPELVPKPQSRWYQTTTAVAYQETLQTTPTAVAGADESSCMWTVVPAAWEEPWFLAQCSTANQYSWDAWMDGETHPLQQMALSLGHGFKPRPVVAGAMDADPMQGQRGQPSSGAEAEATAIAWTSKDASEDASDDERIYSFI
mgnify:FL=1